MYLCVPICKVAVIKILGYVFRVLCNVSLKSTMSADAVVIAARD